MSLLPAPDPGATPEPAPGSTDPTPPGASPPSEPGGSGAPASQDGTTPSGIPAKFVKDGVADYDALARSYGELERYALSKEEQVRAKVEQERLSKRPEKAEAYTVPEIEGVAPDELAQHPLTTWWREHAFQQGLDQEGFAQGISQYIQANRPNLEQEKAKLGENAETRTRALGAWVYSQFTDSSELAAIEKLCSTADGVRALERIMQAGSGFRDQRLATAPPSPEEAKAEIERLMSSDGYWNQNNRDPEAVRRVEAWFERQAVASGGKK